MTDSLARRHSLARSNLNTLRSTCAPTSIRSVKRSGSRLQERRHLQAVVSRRSTVPSKQMRFPSNTSKQRTFPLASDRCSNRCLRWSQRPGPAPGISCAPATLLPLQTRRTRRTRLALVSAALVALGMSALFVFQPWRIQDWARKRSAGPGIPEKSIAVFPFENLSDQKGKLFTSRTESRMKSSRD